MGVLTQFQARCRGTIVRRKLFTMLQHYYEREDSIIKIQAYWKGKMQRRKFRQLVKDKKLIREDKCEVARSE